MTPSRAATDPQPATRDVQSLFKPFTLRRAILLVCFAVLVYVFRRLLPLFVCFVAFERSMTVSARWLGPRIGARKGIALFALLGLVAALIVMLLGFGIGSGITAVFEARSSLPDRIEAFSHTDLYARLSSYVEVDRLIDAAKENASHFLEYLARFGHLILQAVIAFILALVYVLEEDEILGFKNAQDGNSLSGTLLRWFGYSSDAISVTLQFQMVVAAVNALLTVPVMILVGIPHAGAFLFMVFFSGLVPLVGNLLSGSVLTLLAYQSDGWRGVIAFTILTAVLHKVESYYLTPRLAARHVHLPGFVLIVSLLLWENLIGFTGLLVSFPFLYLVMRIRNEFDQEDRAGLPPADDPGASQQVEGAGHLA